MCEKKCGYGHYAAALVERAYRMALVLKSGALSPRGNAGDDCALGFAHMAISLELVDLLDEARTALLALATEKPPGLRMSAGDSMPNTVAPHA